MKYYVKLFVAK